MGKLSRKLFQLLLSTAEQEKERAFFTHFVVSTDGMLGREANFLLKQLTQRISMKWDKPLGQVTGLAVHKALICYHQAANLCLCGFRTKWSQQSYQALLYLCFINYSMHYLCIYCYRLLLKYFKHTSKAQTHK